MSSPMWRLFGRHRSPSRRSESTPPAAVAAAPERRGRAIGQSVVEFALVVPILLLILAGAIDLGRAFYAYVAVENAAKEGALYGARHPLCDGANATCPDPRNVQWIVDNEAANLRGQLSTTVSCRTPAGSLIQPINDCVNGDIYVVRVTHDFRLATPILGDLMGSTLTLGATSEATVVEDAFDPTGLEILVWVDKSGADNASDIVDECILADPSTSAGYYYAPCQDQLNRYNYLQFQEGDSVSYKVRVRNTGNVDLTGLTYGFLANGSTFKPSPGCKLPTALPRNSAPGYCTFSRTVSADNPVGGVADDLVEVNGQGLAEGLPTGGTSGSATIKVIPAPRLTVNLRAAPYRLGGDGNGVGGAASYSGGDWTFDRTNDGSADPSLRSPTGWLKVSVVNSGGPARNFSLLVTEDGSTLNLPNDCPIPTTLAAGGSPGDAFMCIFPRPLPSTHTFKFLATASARNATYSGGDPSVQITTKTCSSGQLVVPDLVDTLVPAPDETNKTVGQARSLWLDAGFTGSFSTVPSSASSGTPVLTQNVDAYTCEDVAQNIQVSTR